MKRLVLLLLFDGLLVCNALAANNQRIVFSGTGAYDNVGVDMDSAYLYIYRYDEVRDSALVTAEDLSLVDGCYSHQITVEQDSGSGWYGYWLWVHTESGARLPEAATVTMAPDTASLKADTTGLSEGIYAEFIDGSNEDQFKATGFALHTQVDSLKDTVEDMSTRLLADVSGLSTFDHTTDKVTLVDSSADGIHDTEVDVLAVKAQTDKLDFDGQDSLLTKSPSLNDLSAAEVQSEVEDGIDAKFIFDNDSVITDQSTHVAVGDTNTDPFDNTADSVMTDVSVAGTAGNLIPEIEDAVYANRDDYKADVSGVSTFDHTTDNVTVGDLTNPASELITDGVWGDTTTHFTQSGTFGKLLVEDSCCGGGGGAGDTNNFEVEDIIDSMRTLMADSNLARYSKREDYKSDVSGLSTFDPSSDKVTLVDSSADGIHDIEVKLEELGLYDSSLAAVNAAGLSTLTDAQLRDAIGDSLYSERVDTLITMLGSAKTYARDLAYYWGACDGCYYRLYPAGGTPNKDSVVIIDPSLGADSLVGKILYLHGTVDGVVDTAYFYVDEPW